MLQRDLFEVNVIGQINNRMSSLESGVSYSALELIRQLNTTHFLSMTSSYTQHREG